MMLGSVTPMLAADVTGKWTAETLMGAGGAEQPVPTTFMFKVDGSKLTGTVVSPLGEFEIQDGKVDGDAILFNIEVGGSTIAYDGLIKEEGIDFIAKFVGRDRSNHFLATRVPS
jgi:hypothetical protein